MHILQEFFSHLAEGEGECIFQQECATAHIPACSMKTVNEAFVLQVMVCATFFSQHYFV